MGQTLHKLVFQPPQADAEQKTPLASYRKYIQLKTSRGETIYAYHVDYGYVHTHKKKRGP